MTKPRHGKRAGGVLGEQFVIGGAPGGSDMEMPAGVGFDLASGSNVMLSLEVHYNNLSNDTALDDSSGVELCVTHQQRALEAGVHWLGSVIIDVPAHDKACVISTCHPSSSDAPVHIMAITPHMHRTGVHANVVLNRASGERVTLLDVPYSWQEQREYLMPVDRSSADVVVNPGDTLTTTCSYENDSDAAVVWGETSEDEMCFMMVSAWPLGGLHNNSPIGSRLAS